MSMNLVELRKAGEIQTNTANQESTIISHEIGQGVLDILHWQQPSTFLLATYDEISYTVPTGGEAQHTFSLTHNIQKPDKYLIPSWPDLDGYTFVVYRTDAGGTNYTTRMTINSVDWTNNTVTVDTSALTAGSTYSVRISYLFHSGNLKFKRKTPVNSRHTIEDPFLQTSVSGINSMAQVTGNPLTFDPVILIPEYYFFMVTLDSPAVIDIGETNVGTGVEEYDVTATKIMIKERKESLKEANERYLTGLQEAGLGGVPIDSIKDFVNLQMAGKIPPLTAEEMFG